MILSANLQQQCENEDQNAKLHDKFCGIDYDHQYDNWLLLIMEEFKKVPF